MFAAFLAVGLAAEPNTLPKYTRVDVPGGCYINAIGYKTALTVQEAMEKVTRNPRLMYVDIVKTEGHALCVFNVGDRWKIYDTYKSHTRDIGTFPKEPTPQQIAERISPDYKNPKWYE